MVILAIILLCVSLLFVLKNKWLSNILYKPSYIIGSADLADILSVTGFLIMLFALTIILQHFTRFNPGNFIWIGTGIGILISFIHMYKCIRVSDESGRDKYSGGGSGMLLLGCLGFIVFPLVGLLIGYLLKLVVV